MRMLVFLVVLLVGCATGPNRYEREFNAYTAYLTDEVNGGRMSRPQAEYLATQKLNQLVAQKNANDAQGMALLGVAAGMQQQSNPYGPGTTQCTFFGNTMTCR